MGQDALITVIDGQSLRFSKIRNTLDPLVLTHRATPLQAAHTAHFSLDTVNDLGASELVSEQKSGHYSMTVPSFNAEVVNRFFAVREVTILQGELVSRIDVSFSDEPQLNQLLKETCAPLFKD